MGVLHEMVQAIWQQDFSALADPRVLWAVYSIMFITLLLENGLLPASFLPGDSLLLLAGAMIGKGIMAFIPTMLLLTLAASLGYWLSYLQGRWLGNTRLVQRWLLHLPASYHQRAQRLFDRHGMLALLIGRFLAFIRTLLPTLAGMSDLNSRRFQCFNWLSGLLWVSILITLGYLISQVPLIQRYEDQVMTVLMILPLLLLCTGLAGSILFLLKRHKRPR